jgi:hypothetical protein
MDAFDTLLLAHQNRLWFAEYAANRIAMFDPANEQIKEWKLPTARSQPYDVAPTKGAAEVWTGSMLTDQVARLNPKTDEIVEYLLPRNTNIRRVFVIDSGPRPVLWVGNWQRHRQGGTAGLRCSQVVMSGHSASKTPWPGFVPASHTSPHRCSVRKRTPAQTRA